MRIGSLCSGAGGLDMAVERMLGAKTAWHCEIDPAASKVLAHRYPGVPNHRDLTTTDWDAVEPVDILTGGFPCQPFSHAGQRNGENDERHLWPFVLEAIRALRPRYTLLENVAGLRSIGGQFNEPTLRCVCGWTGRRGGVHYRQVEQDRTGHLDPSADRHGDEISCGASADAEHLRRDANHAGAKQPRALADHDVDSDRRGSSSVLAANRTAPAAEVRAGGGGVEDRRDPHLARSNRGAGSLPLDAGILGAVQGLASSAQRAERTWQGTVDDYNGHPVCPACGGPVGDESGGSVFRSGLGTVFRDLASLGMHVRWASLRASDVGAPHQRERLFILVTDPAYAASVGCQWGPRQDAEPQRRGECEGRRDTDRRGAATPYTLRGGRYEGWPESARLFGGSDAAQRGDGPVDLLLPTPAASRSGRNQSPSPGAAIRPSLDMITDLLPTPNAQDGNGGGRFNSDGHQSTLPGTVRELLPTPAAADGARGPDYQRRNRSGSGGDDLITTAVEAVDTGSWGKYAAAIACWEQIAGPAPSPTEPNRNGNPRLNPAFSEWMMGWPAGWVTDVPGISRNDQLRIIGNGVVPQCAEAALVWLLGKELAA